jgi:hypothetical protein
LKQFYNVTIVTVNGGEEAGTSLVTLRGQITGEYRYDAKEYNRRYLLDMVGTVRVAAPLVKNVH